MDMDRIRELIIGFVLVSLIAAAGAIALFDFQSNEKVKDVTTISNETITLSSATAASTGTVSQAFLFIIHSAIRNITTSEDLLPLCNVTTGALSCNATGATSLYIDYTHYTPTYLMNITDNGLIAVDNATSYFGTAGTIAGVALLLTIVIGSFYFITRKRENQ